MIDKSTTQAFQMLLTSRKFLVMLLDVVVSLVLYFVAKYWGSALDDVKFVIVALQPVVIFLIYTIAKDNATEAQAQTARMQSTNQTTNQP